jgi:hypothetical protein
VTNADAKQLELMRAVAPRARAGLALRLSDEVFALSRRAIERAYPELDAIERQLKFVELHYGAELANRLAAWLSARRPLEQAAEP